MLKQSLEQVKSQFAKGDASAEKVRAVEREYAKVNSQLKDSEKELVKVSREVGSFSEKCKAEFSSIKAKIKDAFSAENIKAGLGAVGVAVGGFLKASIDSASAAQGTTQVLVNLLKNQGLSASQASDKIKDFTSSVVKMSTYSAGEAKEALSTLIQRGMTVGQAFKEESTIVNIAAVALHTEGVD